MKKIYSLIAIIMATVLMFSSVSFVFAAEERELTNDEKAAFIVRDEWTGWVKDFTASLSELDKTATAKIYDNMDFYDMQYRFTEKYKKVPEYLDEDGKPTQKLKDMIKEKRKEVNLRKAASKDDTGYKMIDWSGVNDSTWMSKLPDNRYLNDINIPGVANAALAETESQAIGSDTNAVVKARKIAMRCKQSNSVYPNLQSGYRAFDYGLSYEGSNLLISAYANQLGTNGGDYQTTFTNSKLDAELGEMVRFLINNPKECIVLVLRFDAAPSGGSASAMANLIKNLINTKTFPYVDGDKTTVNLKDFVYVGNTFPKLKDVRKKIVIVSRIPELNIGIPLYKTGTVGYHYNILSNGDTVDGVSMYAEEKEYHYTADEKVTHVTNSLNTVTTKNISTDGTKGKNGSIIYTSGYKLDNTNTSAFVAVKPSEIADKVNRTIYEYNYTQGKLVGILLMDFANDGYAPKIYKSNP